MQASKNNFVYILNPLLFFAEYIYFFNAYNTITYFSQIKSIVQAAVESGLGYTWLGVTDNYKEGRWRYLSSGRDVDFSNAAFAWGNDDHGSSENCVVSVSSEHIHDTGCDNSFYGLCEIETSLC